VTWAAVDLSLNSPSPLNLLSTEPVSSGNGIGCAGFRWFAATGAKIWSGFSSGETATAIGAEALSAKTTAVSGWIACDSRIPCSYSRATRRGHCGKVARRTSPCESERGRQSPVVLESAERVTQGHFDATVSNDRVHLRTIAIPQFLGPAPSNLSRCLRGSVP
jgi:hypothetical protein